MVTSTVSNIGAIGVARLLATNGQIDTTFDADGIATVNFSSGFSRLFGIALQSNGKILVSGRSGEFGTSDSSVMMRLNPNGSLDTLFSSD